MLTLYIICGVVGMALAVIIAVGGEFGQHEFDSHVELDAHGEAGSDGHSGGHWMPLLSVRFWTYFLAGFGATGLLLDQFARISSTAVLVISLATGIIAGFSVAILIRVLRRSEATSAANSNDMLGIDATVLVAIRGGQPGKIRCKLKGETIDYMAITDDPTPLEAGEHVIVTAIENGRALVIPRSALFDESLTVG